MPTGADVIAIDPPATSTAEMFPAAATKIASQTAAKDTVSDGVIAADRE
jgi:hypothetical protein